MEKESNETQKVYDTSTLSEHSQSIGKERWRRGFSMLVPEDNWEERCAWGTLLKSLHLLRDMGGEGKKSQRPDV